MRLFFRKSGASGRLSISLSGGGVTVASVVRDGDKPRVASCMVQPDGVSWEAAAKNLQLNKFRCLLLLKPGEYQLLQVEAPSVPEAELKQAVAWKLKDMLAYPVEQATVDVIAIPQDRNSVGRNQFLYAVVARNETIKRHMDDFESVGAELDTIDIPELAQRNIAALLEEDGRGLALLSFNDNGGLLTFTAGGELYHARSIEISAQQLAAVDPDQRAHYFERLVLELQRSLDNFERQFSYVTINKLLIGPMVGQATLEEYLRENLYLPVSSLELSEIMNLAAVEDLENPAFQAQRFLTLGAALREEGAAS